MPGTRTPNGNSTYDHRGQTPEPVGFDVGDPEYIDAVTAHVHRTVGDTGGKVFHEILSPYVHLDVLVVPPGPERPWTTLTTCGAGARKMNTPPEMRRFARMELALCLPPDWPSLDGDAESGGGPGRWIVDGMMALARMPFQFNTWFGFGHTIPNGDPPEPITEGTGLCCSLLTVPHRIADPAFGTMTLPNGEPVYFWSLFFLHRAEMNYKLRKGAEALLTKMDAAGHDELLRLSRPSVCRGGFLGFFTD